MPETPTLPAAQPASVPRAKVYQIRAVGTSGGRLHHVRPGSVFLDKERARAALVKLRELVCDPTNPSRMEEKGLRLEVIELVVIE